MKMPQLPDDFAATAVPDERTVSGVRIGFVIIGMGVTVTAFVLAAQTVIGAGFVRGVLACLVAGVVLAAGGALTGFIGARSRLSVYVVIEFTFGRHGAKLVNLFLTLLTFGFFCVLGSMLGSAVASLAGHLGYRPGPMLCSMSGSLLVGVATLYGFQALQRITFVLLPLLACGLLLMAMIGMRNVGFDNIVRYPGQGLSFGLAVSAVLGGCIGFVVLFPNLTRFARRGRDGVIAAVLGMGVGFPIILTLSAISAVAAGQSDVVAILSALGFGALATALAAVSIWKTNVLNLYSSYLGFSVLRPGIAPWKIVVLTALVGGLLGAIDVNTYFMPFLLFLGVATPPIAVIYTIDYLATTAPAEERAGSDQPAYRWPALLSWTAAAAIGTLSIKGILTFSSIPAIDSTMAAGVIFGGLRLLLRSKYASTARPSLVSRQ